MATYKNEGGEHVITTEAGDIVIGPGAEFSCDDPELCKKFPNKFTVVGSATPPAKPTANDPVDVTDDFQEAVDGDLTVTKEKGKWYIFDDGAAINEDGLKKKDVVATITEYLEG